MQLGQLQKIESGIIDLGYQIIAISADRPEKLAHSIDKHKLTYRLLSDSKLTVAKAFGIVYKVDEKTIERYKRFNIDLADASGEKHHLLPVPSVFIVSQDGRIKFQYVNPNYKVRVDPEVLYAAAKAALKQH